jgi:hypothetical protein
MTPRQAEHKTSEPAVMALASRYKVVEQNGQSISAAPEAYVLSAAPRRAIALLRKVSKGTTFS